MGKFIAVISPILIMWLWAALGAHGFWPEYTGYAVALVITFLIIEVLSIILALSVLEYEIKKSKEEGE